MFNTQKLRGDECAGFGNRENLLKGSINYATKALCQVCKIVSLHPRHALQTVTCNHNHNYARSTIFCLVEYHATWVHLVWKSISKLMGGIDESHGFLDNSIGNDVREETVGVAFNILK